ncbi:MepB family protein [Massilia sp. Dwa41.01b]|uniref:MepB family protein n=1 Tax=unclassified Massilia TaxID=2609279 RepID=UPI0015FF1FCE|nr:MULTISPECIES: MepB family protein [unclassified Massilia]QNA90527.1 MepB family protein [Massilia sp. Dwa41.01b]QNA97759.1 MepB family protein [Massilia sp. Se16.2.3]
MTATGDLPPDLPFALDGLYREAGVSTTAAPRCEPEGGEYGACRLGLDGRLVAFRVAKTTPTKIGQFVTVWKRPAPGADIAPFDSLDEVDLVIVSVAGAGQHGHFVFDRQALIRHGVMSQDGVGGKRAIRVYPPWSLPVAKAAIRAQGWQLAYFVSPAPMDAGAPARLRRLLHA